MKAKGRQRNPRLKKEAPYNNYRVPLSIFKKKKEQEEEEEEGPFGVVHGCTMAGSTSTMSPDRNARAIQVSEPSYRIF